MRLTNKQKQFIEQYLVDFNGTQAAIRAGYSAKTAKVISSENLTKPDVAKEIRSRIMSADEVLMRLGDIARGDFADMFDITPMGFVIDLNKAAERGKTKLIKKIKQRTTTIIRNGEEIETTEIEIELHDALQALIAIGKFHKLFTERFEQTGQDGGPVVHRIEVVLPNSENEDTERKLLPSGE